MRSWRAAGLALLILMMGNLPARALSSQEAARIFSEGNDHYAAGRFEEAVVQYQSLLDRRFESAAVHYNLGNALFKLDRLGPAILEYERAARLAPRDEDVQANLRYARSLTADKASEGGAHTTSFFLDRLLELTSADQDAAIFAAFYLAAGALAAVWIAVPAGRWRRVSAALLIVMALPLAVSGTALVIKMYRAATLRQAVVLRARVDVLSGPGDDNTTLFTVHEGLRLEVRHHQGGWAHVSLENGLSGWVPAATIGTI